MHKKEQTRLRDILKQCEESLESQNQELTQAKAQANAKINEVTANYTEEKTKRVNLHNEL